MVPAKIIGLKRFTNNILLLYLNPEINVIDSPKRNACAMN